jgi:hypothetical protein
LKKGIKHLLQCHCILPQYKNAKDPVFHKFIAFSVIDESDTVVVKYANCNSCGAVHKVYDICKSEIMVGKDDIRSGLVIEDFKLSLPSQLYDLLSQYSREICDYEYAQFIIDNSLWEEKLVLSREDIEDHIQGKSLKFLGPERFRIESYTHKIGF